MFENVRRHFEVPVDARVIVIKMVDEVRLVTSALVPVPFAAVSHVAANAPATWLTVSAIAGEPVSNSKPLGALRIRMPEPISPGFVSSIEGWITKFVQAGALPVAALSADICVPCAPMPTVNRAAALRSGVARKVKRGRPRRIATAIANAGNGWDWANRPGHTPARRIARPAKATRLDATLLSVERCKRTECRA